MALNDVLAEAYVKVGYQDLKNLDKQINDTGKKFVNEFDKMGKKSSDLTKTLGALGTGIATLGIAKFGHDIVGAATKMDSFNRMLVNVEGSQEKANKRFEEFRKLAKEPVLDPMNLSKYYVGLKSVNVEAEKSIPFMKNLANAMAGVGAGNQQFALAMEQFVQMAGKGKVMGDDLRAIANSFPQIRKFLIDAFGTAIPEELEKKGLTATQVMQGLTAEMAKLPKFADGAQAAQENFTQALDLFYAGLGKNVLPTISTFLNKLTELMDKFGELPEGTKKVIGTAGMAGVGLLGIAAALNTISGLVGPVAKGLKDIATTQIANKAVSGGGAIASGGASFASGVASFAIKASAVTIAAASVYWMGEQISKALNDPIDAAEAAARANKEVESDRAKAVLKLNKDLLEITKTFDDAIKAIKEGMRRYPQAGELRGIMSYPELNAMRQSTGVDLYSMRQQSPSQVLQLMERQRNYIANQSTLGSLYPDNPTGWGNTGYQNRMQLERLTGLPLSRDQYDKMGVSELKNLFFPEAIKDNTDAVNENTTNLKSFGLGLESLPSFDPTGTLGKGLESRYGGLRPRENPLASLPIRSGPYMEGIFPYADITSPLYRTAEQAIGEAIAMPFPGATRKAQFSPFWIPGKASGEVASQLGGTAPAMNEFGVYFEDIAKKEEWAEENAKQLALENENLAKTYKDLMRAMPLLDDMMDIGTSLKSIEQDWSQIMQTQLTGLENIKENWQSLFIGIDTMLIGAGDLVDKFLQKMLGSKGDTGWSSLSGILSGALSGGTVGSAFGPWGTLIGAFMGGVSAFQEGGIVDRPTFAIVGEKGREYIFNEKQMKSMTTSGNTYNVTVALPNANIDNITEDQIYRLVNKKIIPALQKASRTGSGAQYAYYG